VKGGLTFTGSGLDWYADQRPDFAKLGLTGRYEWTVDSVTGEVKDWGDDPDTPVAAGTGETKKAASYSIPITDGYPAMDKTQVASNQLLKVGIGYDNSVTVGDPGWIYDGGVATSSPSTGKGYTHYAEVTLGKYYKVYSIEYASPEGDFFAFDDDIKYNDQDLAADGVTKKGNTEKLALVKASKLRFNVTYTDGTTVTAPKTITWNDFYANVGYTLGGEPNPNDLFNFVGATRPSTEDNTVPILAYDDDYYWSMQLKYVPIIYGDLPTYLGIVNVPLPVYAFEGLNAAVQKTPNRLLVQYTATPTNMATLKDETNRQLIDAINDTWTLTGNYEMNGQTQTKALKFDAEMFNKASKAIASGGVTLTNAAIEKEISELGTTSAGEKYVLASGQGYILPFKYRGEQFDSEDDAVIVDIYYLGP